MFKLLMIPHDRIHVSEIFTPREKVLPDPKSPYVFIIAAVYAKKKKQQNNNKGWNGLFCLFHPFLWNYIPPFAIWAHQCPQVDVLKAHRSNCALGLQTAAASSASAGHLQAASWQRKWSSSASGTARQRVLSWQQVWKDAPLGDIIPHSFPFVLWSVF